MVPYCLTLGAFFVSRKLKVVDTLVRPGGKTAAHTPDTRAQITLIECYLPFYCSWHDIVITMIPYKFHISQAVYLLLKIHTHCIRTSARVSSVQVCSCAHHKREEDVLTSQWPCSHLPRHTHRPHQRLLVSLVCFYEHFRMQCFVSTTSHHHHHVSFYTSRVQHSIVRDLK